MNQVSQKGLLSKVRRLNQSNNSFFLCFLIYNDKLQYLKSHPCLIIICLIYYNQFQCLTNHETIDIYKEKVKSIKNFHISLGIALLHQLQVWNNVYRLLRLRNLHDNKHISITAMKSEAYEHITPFQRIPQIVQWNHILDRIFFKRPFT